MSNRSEYEAQSRQSFSVSRRSLLRSVGLVGVGAVGTGLIGCRNRPEQELDLGTTPTFVQAGGTLSGRVTGLLGGGPGDNVAIRISGVGEVATDSQGRFEVRIDDEGDYTLIFTGRGYVRRLARIRLRGNVNIGATLLEENAGLSMRFLDQYARGQGSSKEGVVPRTPGATNRWQRVPTVRIYRQLVGGGKGVVSDARLAAMQGSIASLFGALTGNALGGSPAVEVRPGSPPERLGDVPAGVLAIVQRSDRLLSAEHSGSLTDPYEISKARIACGADSTLEIFNRMYAHALGGWVVSGSSESVLNPRGRSGASTEDQLAARYLYRRAPGTRAPDEDPAGVFLNA